MALLPGYNYFFIVVSVLEVSLIGIVSIDIVLEVSGADIIEDDVSVIDELSPVEEELSEPEPQAANVPNAKTNNNFFICVCFV